jgi:hypothetical protein
MNLRSIELLARTGVSRREMLGTLARWTAPTVLTLTLATRRAAAVSCPPCTRQTGNHCRACNMNQILNCQCEPCLGPPYCSGAPLNAVMQPSASGAPLVPAPGSAPGAQVSPYFGSGAKSAVPNPFRSPLERSPFSAVPFGGSRPYGTPRDNLRGRPRTLFDRLRADQRRPF